jgi:hypothetical protein
MAGQAEEIAVISQIMPLEQVLLDMASGRLRLPSFQRPFVWQPDRMLKLFDSIERGYPIGSLVIWEAPRELPSLNSVAGIKIPPAPKTGLTGYVLDGNQRLTTLFGALHSQPRVRPQTESQKKTWAWDIYRVLGDNISGFARFQHWTSDEPYPAKYLPMWSVLRTIDFLAYKRHLTNEFRDDEVLAAELIDEAEHVAYRIKSYQVAVVRLQGSEIGQAIEVFSRLNSSGQLLSANDLAAARAYQAQADQAQAQAGKMPASGDVSPEHASGEEDRDAE